MEQVLFPINHYKVYNVDDQAIALIGVELAVVQGRRAGRDFDVGGRLRRTPARLESPPSRA